MKLGALLKCLTENCTSLLNCRNFLSKLALLCHLAEPAAWSSTQDLGAAGRFLDQLLFTNASKIDRPCSALVFNIPDCVSADTVRATVLSACSKTHVPCLTTRMWKRSQEYISLVLWQFPTKVITTQLISKQRHITVA